MPGKKRKIDVSSLTPYQLGIIWSIGSFAGGEMIFRHKDRYFLEQLQPLTESNIQCQVDNGKQQYKLKTALFDMGQLERAGWTPRNASQRDVPILDNYADFLRAYLELHSSLDYCISYARRHDRSSKYYRLRLRIYGNTMLIQSIDHILEEQGCTLKQPQPATNATTMYIVYTALEEIQQIYDYVSGQPCNPTYWQDADTKLRQPRRYVL